jgi:hypothetical protein
MTVFIANFGRGNALWADCLSKSVIATFADEDIHALWRARDKDRFIDLCVSSKMTAAGIPPTRSVASRWYNVGDVFAETDDDLWIHREKDDLWWTTSNGGEMTESLEAVPMPGIEAARVYVLRKPTAKWQKTDRGGRTLAWNALHAKARDFLSTESTVQKLSTSYAEYALALVDGRPLEPWHLLEEWKKKADAAKRGAVRQFSRREVSARQMAQTAIETAAGANGQTETRKVKVKNLVGFDDHHAFERYVLDLLDSQEDLCALSGLQLQHYGDFDDEQLLCSLDRIDSDGHYERGNLQIVCRFINRWKCDSKDAEFRRLLRMIQEPADL